MDAWWNEIDDEILALLTASGPMNPADLAHKLGMSTTARRGGLNASENAGVARFPYATVASTSRAMPAGAVNGGVPE